MGRNELSDVNTNNGIERLHRTVKAELGVTDNHQMTQLAVTIKIIDDFIPSR